MSDDGPQALRFGGYLMLVLALCFGVGGAVARSDIWVVGVVLGGWGFIYLAVGVALHAGDE